MLTQKQEKFIQGVISGLTQKDAFREAYPNSKKWKDTTVDTKAYELSRNPKVVERLKELREKEENAIIEKNLWDYEKAMKALLWIMQQSQIDIKDKGLKHASSRAFIDAVKELNDLQGLGEGHKTKIDLHTDTKVVIVDDI